MQEEEQDCCERWSLRRTRCSFCVFTAQFPCVATAVLAPQGFFFFSVFYFYVEGERGDLKEVGGTCCFVHEVT